jgi:hypothetical protein
LKETLYEGLMQAIIDIQMGLIILKPVGEADQYGPINSQKMKKAPIMIKIQ